MSRQKADTVVAATGAHAPTPDSATHRCVRTPDTPAVRG